MSTLSDSMFICGSLLIIIGLCIILCVVIDIWMDKRKDKD